ncbi:hypothetical protein CTAYLR_005898 [Chrysophaeum taylorii]|uniref:Guanine nucleotide-binding protein subunit beta-like protein n=1 Tax=Chrysophaeum taylorii TaxID=2483200 RepID=A0AAD7XR73_9STRA|nr:hypothetical protein CTAYLR_005871 [Chrysophaeum taylorii]KAJ8614315.1 hypothetical protein CTAYLR_005898 [Chrysophaeum taylorii]
MAEEKAELKARIKASKDRVKVLSEQVQAAIKAKPSPLRADAVGWSGRVKAKRKLAGHFGKVVSITWARDGVRAMTAAQDGNVIVWNAPHAKKASLVPLKSSWVMFAEMTQDGAELFATGGLDNAATIWRTPGLGNLHKLEGEWYGHEGYVCSARFVGDSKLVTTSGDGTAALWDLNKPQTRKTDKEIDDRVTIYRGHEKDVSSIDLDPIKTDNFVTSSTDGTCMLWSLSQPTPNAVMRLVAPIKRQHCDINKAKFMPTGMAVAMATEARGALLYDTRTRAPLNTFNVSTPADVQDSAKYSLAFSKSGRLLFVACEDSSIEIWDTLLPDATKPLQTLANVHTARVTDVAVPASGLCLGAVSWDTFGSVTNP